jgi:small conductance mechanosensitive channel
MTAAGALNAVLGGLITHFAGAGRGALALDSVLSFAVVAAAFVGSRLLRKWVLRQIRALPGRRDAERHIRTRRIAVLARRAGDLALAFAATACLASIWGVSGWLFAGPGARLLALAGRFAVVIFATFVVFEAATLAIHHLMVRLIQGAEEPRRAAQLSTLSPFLKGLAQTTILIVGALTFLSEAGVRIGPLLAGAGVVGIAVGFGAQSLVKDVLTGVFLIAEDIVTVGDVVEIEGASGVVEQMTLRTIRLRGLDGALHIFPYGEAQVVHNMTKAFAYSVFDLQIAYDADMDHAFQLISDTGADLMVDPKFKDSI